MRYVKVALTSSVLVLVLVKVLIKVLVLVTTQEVRIQKKINDGDMNYDVRASIFMLFLY